MMTLAILENLQRDDLTVLDEARSLQNLVNKQGMTHATIADKLGKSRPYISNAIRILSLPGPVLQLIEDKNISQGHARLLLSLDTPEEQIAWARRIDKEKLSVKALSLLLNKTPNLPTIKSKNIFIKEAEENLSQSLGTSVSIQSKKIEISYDNLEELNRLILILINQ